MTLLVVPRSMPTVLRIFMAADLCPQGCGTRLAPVGAPAAPSERTASTEVLTPPIFHNRWNGPLSTTWFAFSHGRGTPVEIGARPGVTSERHGCDRPHGFNVSLQRTIEVVHSRVRRLC